MQNRSALLTVMTAAAIKAGKAILRDFGELGKLQVSRKGTADFATSADRRSEKVLHQELAKARPSYGFLMEEGGEIAGSDPFRFVIDPIDGTNNFIHAVPYFCISIACEKKLPSGKYETQGAVIYEPINNELFCAELYQGAYLNDYRIQVSGRSEPDTCMLATFMVGNEDDTKHAEHVHAILAAQPFTLRATGSTALDLAYVAAGRYDGACYTSYKPWDVAAGALLVREAGGKITQGPEGGKKLLLAGNTHLYAKLAAPLKL